MYHVGDERLLKASQVVLSFVDVMVHLSVMLVMKLLAIPGPSSLTGSVAVVPLMERLEKLSLESCTVIPGALHLNAFCSKVPFKFASEGCLRLPRAKRSVLQCDERLTSVLGPYGEVCR